MLDRGDYRKPFNSLRSPFSANLLAGDAPDLLGVGFEKRPVQLAAKPVDEEIFEAALRLHLEQHGTHVAEPDPDGLPQPQLRQRIEGEPQRILEKTPHEVDAGFSWPQQ